MSESRRWIALSMALGWLALGAGCSALPWRRTPTGFGVRTIAILPLERAESPSETPARANGQRLAANAEGVVTAQIYGVLSDSPRWRMVPDLVAAEALRTVGAPAGTEQRARALGRATGAEGVLCGSVSRFVERRGSEMGARDPASVSLELRLVLTESGEVVWRGVFDETQQALSSNLLNWWMFWRAGPRWFSAAELARLGVEKLIDDLEER